MIDEQIATRALEAFQRDLLAVVQQQRFALMPNVVVAGLLEVLGAMLVNGVRQEPDALPRALYMIEQLRAHIEAADGSAEAPPLRLH